MEQTEGIKERLKKFAESQQLSIREFERKCGFGNSFVNHIGQSIGVDKLEKILQAFPSLDKDWILYGNGEMLDESRSQMQGNSDNVIMIPVINLDARGGFLSNEETNCAEYVESFMPFSKDIARDGDVVIPIFGDSMAPKYPSGSCVLIRRVVLWMEYLEYGAAYVLDLVDDRRIIKNVQKAGRKDYYLLESVNPKYDPTEISKNMIRNVFRVLMSVRRESI